MCHSGDHRVLTNGQKYLFRPHEWQRKQQPVGNRQPQSHARDATDLGLVVGLGCGGHHGGHCKGKSSANNEGHEIHC